MSSEGETILSAGNIWTSAHARRNELRDKGLVEGDLLCSTIAGFQSLVDFVACAIGGYVYIPVESRALNALRHELTTSPRYSRNSIILFDDQGEFAFYRHTLPTALLRAPDLGTAQLALIASNGPEILARIETYTAAFLENRLAMLSSSLGTTVGGSRLTFCAQHYDQSFVTDTLLSVYNRQTIYLRSGQDCETADIVADVLELGIDDLVMSPELLDYHVPNFHRLPSETRNVLAPLRIHTGGHPLTNSQYRSLTSLFDHVFVEHIASGKASVPPEHASSACLVPLF